MLGKPTNTPSVRLCWREKPMPAVVDGVKSASTIAYTVLFLLLTTSTKLSLSRQLAATLPRTLPDAFSALLASTVNCLSFQLPR
ncbi:hypothetical protein D3C81_1435640 [compost metagenome]